MNSTHPHREFPLILVVDDDKFMRIQLRHAMEQSGYRVAEASDGEQALAIYSDIHPDIVLLDAMMPEMDGFTCCNLLRTLMSDASKGDLPRAVQRSGSATAVPVLMITALEDQESVDRAFEVGASDYITKPIHWAVLRQRVRRILEASRATELLRQQTERAQLNEEQLRLALEAAKMGTWNWDIETGKVTHSVTAEAIYGLASNSFGETFESFLSSLHPEDRELVTQSLHRTLEEKAEYSIEFRVIWPDNSVHWVVSRGQVYYDNTGKPVRMTGINMDTTERKQAEEALRESEARLKLALEVAYTGIWDWNILTNTVTWSDNFEQLFGRETGSFGRTYEAFLDCVYPEDQKFVVHSVKQAVEAGAVYDIEFRIVWSDGSWRWMAGQGKVFYDETGKAVRMLGTTVDITDRKRSQEELQRQSMRSQLFAEVTLKIRQSLQIEEILQTTVTEVQRIFQTDRVLIFQLGSNGFGKIVTEAVNPNWLSVVGQNITDDYFTSEYLRRYSNGRVYAIPDIETAEIPDCLVEFMQDFNVKAKLAVPIFLKEKLWGLLVAHQCATPRQWSSFETELLEQLADQIGIALAQAQLLEQETHQRQELARSNAELQQFASIASHDLQEPLRKIQAFSNRLKDKYNDVLLEQGRDYLDRMQNAAQRMQTLIDDLLMLSRVTTKAQPFVRVNLAQITQEVLSDLEVLIQQTQGRVEVGDLPTIDADPIQMRQLLQNLIGNALKFRRSEESQVVKIYSQQLVAQENPPTGGSLETQQCQIIVEDNGIGFDEKYLDRIFNVFQRLHTRTEYEGTGMGLAICRKIAERHGGSITAESTPGRGAKFMVMLPIKQPRGEDA